jgi:hypothetical protein
MYVKLTGCWSNVANKSKVYAGILMAFSMALSGCPGSSSRPTLDPKSPVVVNYSDPNQDARCTCDQSQAAYLWNPTTLKRSVQTQVTVFDIPTNKQIDSFTRTGDITNPSPPPGPFLGCTLAKSTSDAPRCDRKNVFNVLNDVVVKSASGLGPAYLDLGSVFANDMTVCYRSCSIPDANCLPLGRESRPLLEPVLRLVNIAASPGVKTIHKADFLKDYKLSSSDDKCGRAEEIEVHDGNISNSADGSCDLSTSDYSTSPFASPALLHLPKMLEAHADQPSPFASYGGTAQPIVRFDTGNSSPPYLSFGGDHGSELTKKYGGFIQSAERFGNNVVMATSNGCVSIKTK